MRLYTKQDAYLDGTHENPHYRTEATGDNGKEYVIKWDIINPDAEAEDEACNWEIYDVYDDCGRYVGDQDSYTVYVAIK